MNTTTTNISVNERRHQWKRTGQSVSCICDIFNCLYVSHMDKQINKKSCDPAVDYMCHYFLHLCFQIWCPMSVATYLQWIIKRQCRQCRHGIDKDNKTILRMALLTDQFRSIIIYWIYCIFSCNGISMWHPAGAKTSQDDE